jgi:hypothetical protein
MKRLRMSPAARINAALLGLIVLVLLAWLISVL